jgi:polyisoprenoid-binding protein YceI
MTRTSALAAALLFAPLALATPWEVDPGHSSARFSVKHLTVAEVHGALGEVKGTVELDEADLTRSRVEVTIDARAIETRNLKRDAHLRSKDFLDVRKHPAITFKSTRVERVGEDLKVTGDLTLRGVTRPVVLEVKLSAAIANPFDKTLTRGVKATATIDREAFGLVWNAPVEKGFLVDQKVQVFIDAELRKR